MAQSILHGHLAAFYPGQVYGGVEPYLTAGLFLVFGQHALLISLTALVLSLGAALLTWRVCRRLVASPILAALAGVVVWVAPLGEVWNSTVERGFRGVVMACGLGAMLVALRILDGHRSWRTSAILGLLLGLGWWASPEITYFVVPTGLILLAAVVVSGDERTLRFWVPRIAAGVAGFGGGALPWLWANARSGFASLHPENFAGAQLAPPNGYAERLRAFFVHVLPMQLNSVQPVSGRGALAPVPHWLLEHGLVTLLVLAVVLAALRGGRGLAVVAGVVTFPFLYAAQPGSWFWNDGRYAVFLVPLLAMTAVVACDELASLTPRLPLAPAPGSVGTTAMALLTLLLGALSVVNLHEDSRWFDPAQPGLLSGWVNPESPTEQAVSSLLRAGVRYAYADYWVAYDLDFLSGGRLLVTTMPPDEVLDSSVNREVRRAPDAAWIFVPHDKAVDGYWQFGESTQIAGPGGSDEQSLLSRLRSTRVGFRIVRAGILDAVLPDRRT
jgi:hypothetical protein